jgi:hypothetical protein
VSVAIIKAEIIRRAEAAGWKTIHNIETGTPSFGVNAGGCMCLIEFSQRGVELDAARWDVHDTIGYDRPDLFERLEELWREGAGYVRLHNAREAAHVQWGLQ